MTRRMGFLAGLAVGLFVTTAACQLYDFEPVRPGALAHVVERRTVVTQGLKPNIMLVVDQSGSMLEPIDPTAATCEDCGFGRQLCPSTCPTRVSELQAALSTFLGANGASARFGLTTYPAASGICAPGVVEFDVAPTNDVEEALIAHANDINAAVLGLNPGGGTPTADTLQMLADYPAFHAADDRDNFIILLTDGLPNCNASLDGTTCSCAAVSPQTGQPFSPCPSNLNCMDDARVTQAITTLAANAVSTAIVAFGSDVTGSMARVPLNAMAEAGGFPRACSASNECGADETCELDEATGEGRCSNAFYRAQNAEQLGVALQEIWRIIPTNPCEFRIDASPEDERYVVVYVNGERTESGEDTWRYAPEGKTSVVHFQGALCESVMKSGVANPLEVEIRVVEPI